MPEQRAKSRTEQALAAAIVALDKWANEGDARHYDGSTGSDSRTQEVGSVVAMRHECRIRNAESGGDAKGEYQDCCRPVHELSYGRVLLFYNNIHKIANISTVDVLYLHCGSWD